MIPWGITCFFEKRKDFEETVEISLRYPLQFIEIRGERPFFAVDDLKPDDIRYFRKIISNTGLRVTFHATFYDINLSSLNPYLRNAILECYKKSIEIASEIQAEIMVVHAGLVHKDAAGIRNLVDLARRNLIENLKILGEEAEEKNIIIGLENSPPNVHRLMVPGWQEHRHILKEVNHPKVKGVVDMGHAFLHGHDIQTYFHRMEDLLAEIHVHNNNGLEDQHRAMDIGVIPYEDFFLNNNVTVPAIMEIHNLTEAVQSLEWIKTLNAKKSVSGN
ncbi:MAG: sugar phosphate isomerase/epimerase [Calditrichaeota bacterium]|nr:sugar phosphate isomerase/epimerase [Calditrichota bacterium]RQV92488.1 MAG: sugar phosphate isomerase/epimerase [bacterium]RQV99185.1 MAG: sugar phosphate isomerase/epimerase [Calditrichota bacterium]